MNKTITIFLTVLTFLVSCKSDNLKEVLERSKTPRLDLTYFAVVKAEMQELGTSISIVDRTIDTTSTKLNNIYPSYSETDKVIYWKKEIFPSAEYINGDSLESYENGKIEKYWELRDKHKSGWIELTAPYFTKDKKKVLIEVNFFQGRSFGVSSYYLLEWTGKEYQIIDKGLISIS